jgi:hypothetical protein
MATTTAKPKAITTTGQLVTGDQTGTVYFWSQQYLCMLNRVLLLFLRH